MKIRILVLSLVLQVLLVSCESTTVKDTAKEKSDNESAESRISTIPLRTSSSSGGSEKAPRFIIRRSRPHAVTYKLVKAPLHTFGFGNRNDNGAIITETSTTSTDESRPSTSRALSSNNGTSKVEKIQSKSDIIDFNYNDGAERFYQPASAGVPYKSHPSIYEYNTMHTGGGQKYAEQPKLEFLHAYQFADEQPLLTDPSGQEFVEELEYNNNNNNNKPRQQQIQQQQQQQQPLVEITKSKQYSYTIRKPEPTPSQFQGFPQQQQQQQQLPQAQALYQPQQQYQTFGRETSYLKSTPTSVVGLQQPQQQQEEFKFQRVNRLPTPAPVEKEIDFDEDTKPVHIHHHYPIQHIEESEQQQSQLSQQNNHLQHHHLQQQPQQQQQFVHSQLQQSQQSGRNHNLYFPTPSSIGSGSNNKGQYSTSSSAQFQSSSPVDNPAEQQQSLSIKPYPSYVNPHHSQASYIAAPSKSPKNNHHHHHQHQQQPQQRPETSVLYDLPTPKPQPPPSKWENPRDREPTDFKPSSQFDDIEPQSPPRGERPQSVALPGYPNTNIRIEIPEEEIYKHIQNSVHQIIRDLKDKRTKDASSSNRGRPLAHQDHSWTKYIAQDESRKEKPARGSFNKSATFDPFQTAKPTEKDTFDRETGNSEKPRDQSSFHHQYHQHQAQNQQAASSLNYQHSQRIHHRHQQEEEQQKHFMPQHKNFNSLRIEENYANSAPPSTTRITEATHYENGYPRDVAPATVDITMSHPKKQTPVIDLNALDVGQTWSHDSHFDNEENSFKSPDHTHVYFTHNNRPATSSVPLNFISRGESGTVHPTAPANLTRDVFGSTTQPLYEGRITARPTSSLYPENLQGMASVSSSIHVRDPFPMRQATPTPAFFKNGGEQQQQEQPLEPEVPEVDIMHGMLPVINQFDNGNRVLKVILDPSKMPQELIHDGPANGYQQSQEFPNQQTIQYNMNQQHSIPIVQQNQYAPLKQQQQQSIQSQQQSGNNNFFNQINDQQNYISYQKEPQQQQRKEFNSNKVNSGSSNNINKQQQHGWTNNVAEGSAQVIQYLPPPPLQASRSLLPYDSYSPIYNEELAQSMAAKGIFHQFEAGDHVIMRNKRHRGSEEFKKMIRSYPRHTKKLVKTVKILEPSADLKPPPKYNKFNKKSSV